MRKTRGVHDSRCGNRRGGSSRSDRETQSDNESLHTKLACHHNLPQVEENAAAHMRRAGRLRIRKNRECTLPARQLLSGPSFHLCEPVAIGGNVASATRRGCPGALTPEQEQTISSENPAHAATHNVKCPGS